MNISFFFSTSTTVAVATLLFSAQSHAVISVPGVTVSSLGHRFTQGIAIEGIPSKAEDIFVSADGSFGQQAPVWSADLDSDTSLSYTIEAPMGQKFLIDPNGNNAFFDILLQHNAPSVSAGEFGTLPTVVVGLGDFEGGSTVSFSISGIGAVGNQNGYFDMGVSSTTFSTPIAFTSMTMTFTYPTRNTGIGSQNYTPRDSGTFSVLYESNINFDPGSFTSLVPIATPVPEPATYAAFLSLITLFVTRQIKRRIRSVH